MEDVIPKLLEWGGIVGVLLLVVMGLAWFSRTLIARNEALVDRFIDLSERFIESNNELKELIQNVLRNR